MPKSVVRGRVRLAARQIDLQMGRRIRERRETLGMSRETLAGALGISTEQLRRLEAGVASVVASRLYWLSVILAVPANDFFDARPGAGRRPIRADRHGAEGQSQPAPGEVRRMVNAMRSISDPATRASMIGLVAAIAKLAGSDGVSPN